MLETITKLLLRAGGLIGRVDGNGAGFVSVGGANATIANIMNVFLIFTTMICVYYIAYGGFRYTSSSGDPGAVKSAQATITYAIVGLIVSLLSYMILGIVFKALGIAVPTSLIQ